MGTPLAMSGFKRAPDQGEDVESWSHAKDFKGTRATTIRETKEEARAMATAKAVKVGAKARTNFFRS